MSATRSDTASGLALLLLAACSAAVPAPGKAGPALEPPSLTSPFGHLAVKVLRQVKQGRSECPSPPEPYTDPLNFPSKYEGSGKARDVLNQAAEARYKRATRPMQELEAGLSELSDRYVKGQVEAAHCALDWMHRWAEQDALLGPANMTGTAVRKWTLAAVAFSFLKIQEAPGLDAVKVAQVRDWMKRVAAVVVQEHSQIPPEKINNHFYWAAAAVGAVGIATQDRNLLGWALQAYRTSIQAIGPDGTLPREMARRSRALSYHVFALQPLVMLAEMGRVNGVDLYAEGDCALCRLVRRVTEGIRNPAYFEQQAGTPQVMEEGPDGRAMAWVALLSRACPDDDRLKELMARYRPLTARRLGGNLTDIYEHTSKELPNAVKSKACDHLWR